MARPMNIFVPHCSDMLTDHLPHGDGLTAYGFITHLAKRGHRLHVAAQRVELRHPLPDNVTLYPIALRSSSKLTSRLEYMYRVRALLAELRKQIRFDLVHQLNPVFTGMSLALSGNQLPLVLGTYVARWPSDPDAISSQRGLVGRLATLCRDSISGWQQKQADALLLTTPAAWNRFPEPKKLRGKIHFLPHGIDTQLFSPSPEESSQSEIGPPTILFFANVWKRKGIFTLLDAFEIVSSSLPGVVLRIAGDGADLAEVKRRVAALPCASQVQFCGRQTREQAPGLYRNCSVYCMPSFGEPYGATIQEAMACAKPVVVTDTGAPPYLVSSEGGRCVPTGNAPALAAALTELLQDPDMCNRMGRHNRGVAESTMAWDRVAGQLEEIYEVTLFDWKTKHLSKANAASPALHVSPESAVRKRIG